MEVDKFFYWGWVIFFTIFDTFSLTTTEKTHKGRGKMYRRSFTNQIKLFEQPTIYDQILKDISPNHPLRRMKPYVDEALKRAEYKLACYYSRGMGRPAYPPSIPFKMIFLEWLYKLSDVKVSFACKVNFLFKWFVGLKPEQPPPDDTTLVKFRARLKEEGFREIWNELILIAKKNGLVKGRLRIIDGTHVFSDTQKLGITMLIRQGISKITREVEKLKEKAGKELKKKYHRYLGKVRIGEEKLKKYAQNFIKEVKSKIKEIEDISIKAKEKVIKEIYKLLEALKSLLHDNWEKLVSFTDLDARWGKKSPRTSFGGYKVHITTVPENGLVPVVETLQGNVNEGKRLPVLVEEEKRLGLMQRSILLMLSMIAMIIVRI
jgi:IS5 family transposase